MLQFGASGGQKKTEAGREIRKKAHEAARSRGSKGSSSAMAPWTGMAHSNALFMITVVPQVVALRHSPCSESGFWTLPINSTIKVAGDVTAGRGTFSGTCPSNAVGGEGALTTILVSCRVCFNGER